DGGRSGERLAMVRHQFGVADADLDHGFGDVLGARGDAVARVGDGADLDAIEIGVALGGGSMRAGEGEAGDGKLTNVSSRIKHCRPHGDIVYIPENNNARSEPRERGGAGRPFDGPARKTSYSFTSWKSQPLRRLGLSSLSASLLLVMRILAESYSS